MIQSSAFAQRAKRELDIELGVSGEQWGRRLCLQPLLSFKWPNLALLWLKHGQNMVLMVSFFVNPIYCVQGYILPNFRVLASILTDISDYLQEEGRKGERKEELVSEGTQIQWSTFTEKEVVEILVGLGGGGEQWQPTEEGSLSCTPLLSFKM